METISISFLQLGFGAIGILIAVCSCCLAAIAVAKTKQYIRGLTSKH